MGAEVEATGAVGLVDVSSSSTSPSPSPTTPTTTQSTAQTTQTITVTTAEQESQSEDGYQSAVAEIARLRYQLTKANAETAAQHERNVAMRTGNAAAIAHAVKVAQASLAGDLALAKVSKFPSKTCISTSVCNTVS